jgi:hypothetical protein
MKIYIFHIRKKELTQNCRIFKDTYLKVQWSEWNEEKKMVRDRMNL